MSIKKAIKQRLPYKLAAYHDKRHCYRQYRRRKKMSPSKYPDELAMWLRQRTGEELNLENPKSFNQKVQWLKLYDSTPLKGSLADKYLVRKHVAQMIGEEYLVPLLGVWNSADEISFDILPGKFALKATHGSAWNIIVDNKAELDIDAAKATLSEWLGLDYSFWHSLELHYQYCEPRIIAEQYLDGFATGDLIDYKIHMFNAGDPIILVCRDRAGQEHPRKAYYDVAWNKLDLLEDGSDSFTVQKPKHLNTMLEYSSFLAEGFPLVRVDWYEVNGRLYFGELTFTPAGGGKKFLPKEWNNEFGRRIDLTVLPAWKETHPFLSKELDKERVDAQ